MRPKILYLLVLISLFFTSSIFSQNVKVKTTGLVMPKVQDHTTIVLQDNGQMVYDIDTNTYWYFNGTMWIEVRADNLGNHIATEPLDMSDNKITDVSTPTNNMDAANKLYVDNHEDMDADTLNEIQTLSASVEGDTLYLSGSNWLIVPGISDANHIKDFDGNVYTEVIIGSQTWLKEHLRAVHYNDGTPIPKVESSTEWDDWEASWDGTEYTSPFDAYCWYNNDSVGYNKFGALYNWGVVDSAINGGKNACPVGYRAPTEVEVESLITASGGNLAGLHLKYEPGEWWEDSLPFPFGGKGDNASGFSMVGTGVRHNNNGNFQYTKQHGYIMTTTGGLTRNIHVFRILYDDYDVDEYGNKGGGDGYSIRCIKEE